MKRLPNNARKGDAYVKSSRLGLFIALGAATGVAIGAGSHHIAQGLALGVAFGVAIGMVAERNASEK